jgi:hypothetical protein
MKIDQITGSIKNIKADVREVLMRIDRITRITKTTRVEIWQLLVSVLLLLPQGSRPSRTQLGTAEMIAMIETNDEAIMMMSLEDVATGMIGTLLI